MMPTAMPDFTNKVVLVFLANRAEDQGVILQSPAFEMQAGKVFLVGDIAEGTSENDWSSGVTTAIAWDFVEQYMVFDALEDYFARAALAWNTKMVQ